MSLWSFLFGGDRPSKNDLIRSLAKQRVRQDPMAFGMGFNERTIDSLGMFQVAGLPESTIATIVETYARLKKLGATDHEIFARIEAFRSTIGGRGEIPNPVNLESYTQYRIEIEHGHALIRISQDFIAEAVRVCRQHFGC